MTLFEPPLPLAERLRPTCLDDVYGQKHLLAPGKPLRRLLDGGPLDSLILWGPPGVGKTTLARLISKVSKAHFIQLSAVAAGIKDIRETAEAAQKFRLRGERTVLFLDEIHRFNKTQQDALLPYVESGLLILIGATTENPSFEINPALRSRVRTLVLYPLTDEDLSGVIDRALTDPRGLRGTQISLEARKLLIQCVDGDVRRVLSALEIAAATGPFITPEAISEALGQPLPSMDKRGEVFYNLASVLQKSIRASRVEEALYGLARMISGGVDPSYIGRRLIRIASEDVGLADPSALGQAVAAQQAWHLLGSPEGELAFAQAVIYLALAPKSTQVSETWSRVMNEVKEGWNDSAPLR